MTRRQLEAVLRRRVTIPKHPAGKIAVAQVAPGMLVRHYSPRTPVTLHRALPQPAAANEAWVYFGKPRGVAGQNVFWLDQRGELAGAARRLFSTLRRLDRTGFARIHIELAPGGGLGDAINDRLRRAAAK